MKVVSTSLLRHNFWECGWDIEASPWGGSWKSAFWHQGADLHRWAWRYYK